MAVFGSVRNTLKTIVLLALLPALCTIIYSGLESRRERMENILDEAEELVRTVAFKKRSVTENTRALMLALEQFDEVRNLDVVGVRSIFRAIISQTPFYSNLALLSPQGELLYSAAPVSRAKLEGSTGLIERARAAGHLALGDSGSSETSGLPFLRFAFPVLADDGAPRCLIAGGIQADNYTISVSLDTLPPGSRLYLVDMLGDIFLSSPPGMDGSGEDFAYEWAQVSASSQTHRVMALKPPSGERHILVYHRLALAGEPAPYMTVVLTVPEEAAEIYANQVLVGNLLVLGFVLIVALGVLHFAGEYALFGPIDSVLRMARSLSSGDMTARTNPPALRGEVGALADSFNRMAGDLEEQERERRKARRVSAENDAAKSEFLAAMSHAIRTPMNSVIGIAYLLMKTQLTPRQYGYINRIYTSANTLLGIINDILDFSNIESGRFSISSVPFKLSEVMAHTIALCGQKAEERKLYLTREVAPGVPDNLVGDPLRLSQILTNIVGNAVKFTEQGGIHISCALADGEAAGAGRESVRLRFSVADTGIGMTEAQMTTLFDSFSQADDSISRRFGGTGLGLTITRRLLELMDGDIRVQSVYGKGTDMIFTAVFGVQEATSQGDDDDGDGRVHGRLDGLRVLLVEDNPINQEIAAALLRDAGAEVDIASNGQEAVDRMRHCAPSRYAFVLMDVSMPVMDGYEATRAIRALPGGGDIPIIAMTAHAMAEERDLCFAAGMTEHISKPIEIDRFFATINVCLNRESS